MLEGTLEYHVEGKPPVTLKAGDVLFVPAEAAHSARNIGSTKKGRNSRPMYLEKGKPLTVFVK